jgi:hypothetical protein
MCHNREVKRRKEKRRDEKAEGEIRALQFYATIKQPSEKDFFFGGGGKKAWRGAT